jgi:hypothetical protein
MSLKHGTLMSFNPASYTAKVALSGSLKAGLDGVAVARNISSSEMVAGRSVAVFFPDESNAREAVIIAIFVL